MTHDDSAPGRGGWSFQRLLTRLPLATDRPWLGYAAALVLSGVAALVRFWVAPALPPGFPFLTFFPAVILSAFLFGLRPGIFAGVISGIAAWYFFIPPIGITLSFDAVVAMLFYAGVIFVDIALVHLMQTANGQLLTERERGLQLVRHRDLLFSELQHRVGNNLQMSASLLSLQKHRLVDPSARAALDEAARRLGMIGRVQRQLYDPSGAQLDLATFLTQLGDDLVASAGRDGIVLEVTAEPGLKLPPDAAIPTALIVAEAVSNAVEHAFAGQEAGEIGIIVTRSDGRLKILVCDNGAGLDAQFAEGGSGSLGLRICNTLAQGLHGTFTLEPASKGACARLDLPYGD
jgi:two-component sensor histidine kinase